MKALITVIVLVVALLAWVGYITSQNPQVWCNKEWAGVSMTKGGYRSWSMRFCDGKAHIDGKWQPVVITTNGYRKGFFLWPQFSHVDIRKLKLTNQTEQP